MAGVLIQEVKSVWASVLCKTLSRHTHHRERATVVCRRMVIVVIGGTREPVTGLAEDHDIMIASVLQALDAVLNLYVIHWAVENPNAQLGKRLVLLSLTGSGRVKCGRINYCQYDHIFAKDTCMRTTVLQWVPKGKSGTGMCRKETGNCSTTNRHVLVWSHRVDVQGGMATQGCCIRACMATQDCGIRLYGYTGLLYRVAEGPVSTIIESPVGKTSAEPNACRPENTPNHLTKN